MDHRVTASVLICLAVISITTEGVELRCRCIERIRRSIPQGYIHHVEHIPAGAHCERPEVIITLKGGKHKNRIVCVNPEAKWVTALISQWEKVRQKKSR